MNTVNLDRVNTTEAAALLNRYHALADSIKAESVDNVMTEKHLADFEAIGLELKEMTLHPFTLEYFKSELLKD